MSDVIKQFQELNIFKSFSTGTNGSLDINERGQIVLAGANVVKTTITSAKQNYCKVLQQTDKDFKANDVSYNESGTLVALIGEQSVTVCDTRQLPNYDASTLWAPFSFTLHLLSGLIKCVQWHPASHEGSVLVVLTEREILLYDVMVSFQEPLVRLSLADYPQLRGQIVDSIAFGSKHNFAGMITLYLTTTTGAVYAVAPFVHESLKIRATKNLIAQFAYETKTLLNEIRDSFPPSAVLENPQFSALSRQFAFAEALETQTNTPLVKLLDGDEYLSVSYRGDEIEHQVQGPLAQGAPGSKIIHVGSNENISLLASVHSANNQAVFTYYAQLHPLVMGWNNSEVSPVPPTKPVKLADNKNQGTYKKPSRGFGYYVDAEPTEDDAEEKYRKQLAKYEEQLDLYNLKLKVNEKFRSETGLLTVVATDATRIPYSAAKQVYFREAPESKFLWAQSGVAVVADLARAIDDLLSDGKLNVRYNQKAVPPSATGFALYNDSVGCLGEYIIAFSTSAPVGIVKLKEEVQAKPASRVLVAQNQLVLDNAIETGVSADELSMIIGPKHAEPIPQIKELDKKNVESLVQVNELSREVNERVGEFTKFLLAIQQKIETQIEVLRFQSDSLNELRILKGEDENLVKTDQRVTSLFERQELLFKKTERIRDDVLARFNAIKLAQSLPLSGAEKTWFKELNHMNALINKDKEGEKSMITQIEDLKQKVTQLSVKSKTDTLLSKSAEQQVLENELQRIGRLLKSEDKTISTLRFKVDSCHQLLQSRTS